MDPDLVKWLVAAITKHFSTNAPVSMFLEGHNRRTDDLENYIEFRYSGPEINELSKGVWRLEIDVDVLIVSKDQINFYELEKNVGRVAKLFLDDVPVMKDEFTQVGCATLSPRSKVIVTHFGEVKHPHKMRQATVEATFRLEI